MKQDKFYNTDLYYRLVALWVICEAFAGGLMHAAKIPFTGMVVSSLAVTCIMLISYYIPSRYAVLKATIIVAFFKLMLSPHSPPTAYLAVFFQGYLGHLFFNHRKHFTLSSVALATAALVESALQRILVLVIIYGENFWKAVDIYIQKTAGGTFKDYMATAAALYILLHLITGLLVGFFISGLIKKTENAAAIAPYLISFTKTDAGPAYENKPKKSRFKIWFFLAWSIILGFYLQAVFQPEEAVLPANTAVMIFIRSVLIILTWMIILSPLTMMLIKRFVQKQEKNQYLPIQEIREMIPGMQRIFFASWKLSAEVKGFVRIKYFLRILLINIIHLKSDISSIK
jgi:hypothetical protein